MILRAEALHRLEQAVQRSPVTALLGPRQAGKTTLAREFAAGRSAEYFDLESAPDRARLQNPQLALRELEGLVILDEIQASPEMFSALRVLVDQPGADSKFLILGSASPSIVRDVSESLAGRVEFVELGGFDLRETGPDSWRQLWVRGGFPRSYLATSDENSYVWRDGFIRTFLERDIPQLGLGVSAPTMRRFWTMLAHGHAQLWKTSELARAMDVSTKSIRAYLDVLTGTFMVRQLQPWFENIGKRQVRAPKVYLRDTGVLHRLLGVHDEHELFGHPKVGHSWEGFAMEQALGILALEDPYFWSSYQGAELDLFVLHRGRRLGIEFKFSESPRVSKSMHIALADLKLDHLWVVYPGRHRFPMHEMITAVPIVDLTTLAEEFDTA